MLFYTVSRSQIYSKSLIPLYFGTPCRFDKELVEILRVKELAYISKSPCFQWQRVYNPFVADNQEMFVNFLSRSKSINLSRNVIIQNTSKYNLIEKGTSFGVSFYVKKDQWLLMLTVGKFQWLLGFMTVPNILNFLGG